MRFCRFDKDNEQLQNDLAEVKACMAPADAATLRQRGDGRFKSGDYKGACEAYSLLLDLPTAAVSEADRQACMSNRAACFIVLEKYQNALHDCDSAISGLLSAIGVAESHLPVAPAANGHTSQEDSGPQASAAGPGGQTPNGQAHHDTNSSASSTSNGNGSSARAGEAAPHSGSELTPKWQSLGRLLARRGAAYTHVRQYKEALIDYSRAQAISERLGDTVRAQQLQADLNKLQGLQQPSEE